MAVNLYQTGVSGLLASQQQLATTGHNIANVNTEGYNRQRADQNVTHPDNIGGNYVGTGTYIADITRLYDQFSYKEQILNKSKLGGADSLEARLTQLDQMMSNSGAAVTDSLEQFYQAVNGVASNPNDLGLRSIVLNQANILSTDFNELTSNFDKMRAAVNGEISQVAQKISQISLELAGINETILNSKGLTQAGQPNDLYDKRDQLISELSEFTNVNTIEDTNGVMTVMIGQGTTLVAGITPLTVSVSSGDPDPLETKINLVNNDTNVALRGDTLGGSLGASFEFRDEHLTKTRNDIDLLAMAISSTLNDVQSSGLDLNGVQGTNMFTDINTTALQQGRVAEPSTNTGTLQAEIYINDVSLLTTDEFEVRFDGTDFIMTNMSTGQTENLGAPGSGVPAGTHTPSNPDYGFSFIETGGAPATDDSYVITPTKNSAALMRTTLTDGAGIAASSAVSVSPSTNNVSDGQVSIINVYDPEAAQTFTTPPSNTGLLVDVYESAPGTYSYRIYDGDPTNPPPTPPSVVGAITSGTFAVGSSAVIDLPLGTPAFQIEISGQPNGQGVLAPEKFNIIDAFGIGNGANGLAMAQTQTTGITNNGEETFSQNLAIATSVVGSKASNAQLAADTAEALFTQAYNRNQTTSGVNLDEEAANLLKFQQAYQASSQIISVANTLFDTILSAVR